MRQHDRRLTTLIPVALASWVLLAAFAALCIGQVPPLGLHADKRCLDPAPETITPGCPRNIQPCVSGTPCFWCDRKRSVYGDDMACATELGAQCQQLSTTGVTCGVRMDATCTVGADGISRCQNGVPSTTAVHCVPASRCQ
jgi:hypothetical protein